MKRCESRRVFLMPALVVFVAACQDVSQLTEPETGPSPESMPAPAFAVAAASGTETQITTAGASDPAIDGGRIVWTDHRVFGQSHIYMLDLGTGTETQITSNLEGSPAISGTQIVWNSISGVVAQGIGPLSSTFFPAGRPKIAGDLVVWESGIRDDGGFGDIILFDLVAMTETNITNHAESQSRPAVSGNRIVYDDGRNGPGDIYMYDAGTMTETRITTDAADPTSPVISGSRIVWKDGRTGVGDGQIFMFDLATMTETQITTTADVNGGVGISGDRIVWTDGRSAEGWDDIYMFDLATMTETQITDDLADQNHPAISDDRIVWQYWPPEGGSSNIFMFEIDGGPPTPEDQVEDLADEVQNLLDDGDIPPAPAAELLEKLDVVLEKLDKDKAAGAIKALSQFTNKVKNQEKKGQISTEDADALIAAATAAIMAVADAASRTFICHIKKEGMSGGQPIWTGKVIFIPNDQVPLHCTPHGKFGVTDHNPVVGNLGIGNACGRQKIFLNPTCTDGGIGGVSP